MLAAASLVALLALFPAAHAGDAAVEVAPGVEYAGGTRVGVSALGVSFVVPPAWKGGLPPGAEALLLGSDTEPGIVLVLAKHGVDGEAAAALLAVPLDLGGGVSLAPQGAPRREGGAVLQDHAGVANGAPVSAHTRVTVGPNGTAVSFTVAGPAGREAANRALAETLAASLKFAPVSAAVAAASKVDWRGRLGGQHLYFLKSSGWSSAGSTVERHLYLCGDGTALWGAESSTLVQGYDATTSTAGASADRGRWTVAADVLVVNWSDGSQASYQLAPAADPRELKLNGEVWFFQPNDRCR